MTLFPVTTGARPLGIHPKTLHHWLTAAKFPLAAHPSDARLKCVTEAHLLALASLHDRPLPALSSAATRDGYAAAGLAEEQAKPLPAHAAAPIHGAAWLSAPSTALAELLQQLAQLQTQVASLQHHLTALALEFLQERTGHSDQRLPPLEGLVSQSLQSFQASQQTDVAGLLDSAPLPAHRPLPVEVRARSRVTALIEYGAQGPYLAVCPKLGVLSLVPDSPAWFDWLASLTSFRFVGPRGALFGVSCLQARAVHPLLGGPTLVSWPRFVALSGSH